ncbi:type I restriction-modification system subunit M [Bacteroides sp. 519]|uniref:type I restriction-modification system subunit M n=1 Tax=Bacteroides sp. 519 TaxID=2302937 RepID=UPI0013D5AC4A|nr:type I restriction-modification system subunit M [Bacteroides sp. 519]NDV60469.1 type I restriction-modification system subunit M [Bacteroides sp. 519]
MNKQQLVNKIWASANKMRSKIDANEYKDYILGLIFYKFLSDNEVNYLRSIGWSDDDLKTLVEDYEDPEAVMMMDYCQDNIGYFIEYKYLFGTWLLPESNFSVADLSAALNSFDRLIGPNYKHVYVGIFKTLQTGLSKLGENPASQTRALKDLIKLIKDIPTDGSQDYDVLGYVYEYLISNFAANAGKKAGEFYTPHEVAMLMSEIVAEHHKEKQQIEIYDPTSGSGSLLITIGKSIGRHTADKNRVKYYAQELKENTYNLTRMNLVMRGITPGNIETRCADSLGEDWPLETSGSDMGKPLYVDAVVSNPPYSQHWDSTDGEYDARFKNYGVAPRSKADYAFLLHELHHLKPDGILTIVLPHGVLFRGDAEKDSEGEGKIRKNLIEKNHIDAIIGLPANIFFGTGIPTLIMVLKQHRDNDDILIIDASKGFVKDGKNNRLRACDIKRIADTVSDRATIPGFSRAVSRDEIRQNGYNLNIPRYVDSSEAAESYDIYATMFGGIPESEINQLQTYWDALPSLRADLFQSETDRPYARVRTNDVTGTIEQNADVCHLKRDFADAFADFADVLHCRLITNVTSVQELAEQDEITTDIFRRLQQIPLVDKYMAYQSLSDNWLTITNDIETIQTEGIDAVRVVEQAYKIVKKGDEEIEVPDGLKGRIIPFDLVQRVKFQTELDAISDKQAYVEEIVSSLDELRDGFTEEEAEKYLDEDDNTRFNKKAITAASKEKGDDIESETKAKLKEIVDLWNKQTKLNKEIKTDKVALEQLTIDAIENLSDEDVELFLHKKWIEPLNDDINSILDSVLSNFAKAITFLSNKYSVSYSDIHTQISVAGQSLSELIDQLEGPKFDIIGLKEFQSLLKN